MNEKELQEMSNEKFMNFFERQIELQTRHGNDCNGAFGLEILRKEFLRRTNSKSTLMGEEPGDRK